MDALAGLTPDTDKTTLMNTVDSAVAEIVTELGSGQASPEILKATQMTLDFLQVCQDMKDPEFSQRARIRASELLDAFEKAKTGDDGDGAPKRKKRRRKRKADAVGPDGKPRRRKRKKKPVVDKGWEDTPFTEAFTEYFCKFIRRRAMIWFVPEHTLTPTPFPLASRFGDNLVTAVKEHFIHRFFMNRRVMVLEADLKPGGYTEEDFMKEFRKRKSDNPVRGVWEDGLRDIKRLLTQGPVAPQAKTKVTKKKKAGLFGFFQKEEKVVERQTNTVDPDLEHAKAFWKIVAGPEVTYDPPDLEKDFFFLESLFDYIPGDMDDIQQQTLQLLRQEKGNRESREGAFRDHLNEMIQDLQMPAGELNALWVYLMSKGDFDYGTFKSFTSSHGTTPGQRKSGLPYFLRWLPDYTDMEAPSKF